MKKPVIKICQICRNVFIADPRVGQQQRVCKELTCQRERKRWSQKKWLSQNQNYFKGRYPELKQKILQRRQRNKAPAVKIRLSAAQHSCCIQDELTINKDYLLTLLTAMLHIQDEIIFKITGRKNHFHKFKYLVYKTSNVFIFK
ncbi:MAG: hypothetical protein JW976_01230 [Syntrophaceae bacterium]|nr:hypothetical protein [Syntrophaceae bacterium]